MFHLGERWVLYVPYDDLIINAVIRKRSRKMSRETEKSNCNGKKKETMKINKKSWGQK